MTTSISSVINRRARSARAAGVTLAAGLAVVAAGVPAIAFQSQSLEPERISIRGNADQAQVKSSYSLVASENGRTIRLEMADGVVTRAEIDGKVVPDDRIENDNGTVRLKDESGAVIYEHTLPGGPSTRDFAAFDLDSPAWRALTRPWSSSRFGPGQGASGQAGPGWRTFSWSSNDDDDWTVSAPGSAEEVKAPPVMMGVQLGTADSTLCGHLGLDREKVTLLAGVHEGLPAAAAGLEPYDLIVAVNGSDNAGPSDVRKALEDKKPGDTLNLTVIHKGQRKDVTVTLEAYDRGRLDTAKARRIRGGDDDRFMIATSPQAPLPPLPPSIPGEYRPLIEQYLKQVMPRRSIAISPFRGRGGSAGPQSDEHRRILEDLERQQERAAAQAEDMARQAEEMARRMRDRSQSRGERAESIEEMRQRMERMEEMLRKLMDEKPDQPDSQQLKDKPSGSRT